MAFYQDEGPGVIVGYLPPEIAKTRSMTQYDIVCVSVGNALENLGTPVVDSTGAFQSNQFTLRSWLIAFYNNFVCIHNLPVCKVHFIKRLRLSTEIESESQVLKIRGAKFLEEAGTQKM